MNTMFFNAVSCFFVCAGLIIALILAINVIFHRQSMKIMNIVWVLTGLWGHYFALFAYYTFGVRKDNMVATVPMENMKMDMKISMEMDMSEVRPQWQSITLSALHCGAGCTLADIIGEWFTYWVPLQIGYSTLERNSCRPSFDICGIWGGYTGEGSKTVLPSKAYAKVSCRLVPHQDHHVISKLFADYIRQIAPATVEVKVTAMHGGQGYVCPISLPAYQAAEKGFEIAFGKKPLAVRRGGSIPIISTFEQVLGIKTVLMGFGLESDAIHSPNENFSLDIFRKGIEAVVEFHLIYGKK
jgi:hypothetical protein